MGNALWRMRCRGVLVWEAFCSSIRFDTFFHAFSFAVRFFFDLTHAAHCRMAKIYFYVPGTAIIIVRTYEIFTPEY